MDFRDKFKQLDLGIGTSLSRRPIFKYLDKETGKTIALKRIILRHELLQALPFTGSSNSRQEQPIDVGIPANTIRQISLYRILDHPNIASLDFIGDDPGDHFFRFGFDDYIGVNLRNFQNDNPIRARHPKLIKILMYQLLNGIAFYQLCNVSRENINPTNVLISYYGEDDNDEQVNLLITNLDLCIEPSYQAPEILLESNRLSTAVDMFSAGCIFGEMLIGKPVFDTENALGSIFKLLGTPTKHTMPGVIDLDEKLRKYQKHSPKDLSETFIGVEPAGIDLLTKLLCLNPRERIMAAEALKHRYFDGMKSVATPAAAAAGSSSAFSAASAQTWAVDSAFSFSTGESSANDASSVVAVAGSPTATATDDQVKLIKKLSKQRELELIKLKKCERQIADIFRIIMTIESFIFTLLNFDALTVNCNHGLINIIIQSIIILLTGVGVFAIYNEIWHGTQVWNSLRNEIETQFDKIRVGRDESTLYQLKVSHNVSRIRYFRFSYGRVYCILTLFFFWGFIFAITIGNLSVLIQICK
ncbi:hypothetical protein CsatB_027420 [Cannabis sativa]